VAIPPVGEYPAEALVGFDDAQIPVQQGAEDRRTLEQVFLQ